MTEFSRKRRGTRDLIDRVKAIMVHPVNEWAKIAEQPASVRMIFLFYVIPLAAIGTGFTFIGSWIFGFSAFGFDARPNNAYDPLLAAAVRFACSVVGVFVLALVAFGLAPAFGGTHNKRSAAKLVGYALTPVFLAEALGLLPMLGLTIVLGAIYAVYLLYLGAPVLLHIPHEKAAVYTAVLAITGLAIAAAVVMITGMAAGLMEVDPYTTVLA